MKLILFIPLLLSVSCSSYMPKTYTKVIHYKQIGIRCAQDYYLNYELGKCVYLPEIIAQAPKAEAFTGRSLKKPVRSYKRANERPSTLKSTSGKASLKSSCIGLLNRGEL